jgi:phosphohistidine phosphatase
VELILWRHCDAAAGIPDALRALTARGRDDAQRMARWLAPRLPDACRIVASPATRAQQTVQALKRPYATLPALAPGASVDDVLQAAHWPDAAATTLIVGHEPTLGAVVGRLLPAHHRTLDKGAVVWLTSVSDGAGSVVVKAAIAPDALPGSSRASSFP